MDVPNVNPTNAFGAPPPAAVQTDNMDTIEAKTVLISSEKISPMTYPDCDDDREQDIDDLIDELESQDGLHDNPSRKSMDSGSRIPGMEAQFDTDITTGLTSVEAAQRRKKYGPNQLKEEKENMLKKFLSFFVGPVQFVMEVSNRAHFSRLPLSLRLIGRRVLQS